jgi:hypothetical protein
MTLVNCIKETSENRGMFSQQQHILARGMPKSRYGGKTVPNKIGAFSSLGSLTTLLATQTGIS